MQFDSGKNTWNAMRNSTDPIQREREREFTVQIHEVTLQTYIQYIYTEASPTVFNGAHPQVSLQRLAA